MMGSTSVETDQRENISEEGRWTRLSFWLCALHLFTLCSLAFAKPIFDVTARDAAFYVVRGSRPADITTLIAILSVLIPACLAAIEFLFRLFGRRLHLSVHFLLVGLLISLYAAPLVKHLKIADGYLAVSVISACGVCGAALYARTQAFRRLLSLASPLVLILPLTFIFGSQVGQILLPDGFISSHNQDTTKQIYLKKKPPIIFVQLDELPVVSLLDAKGNLDAKRFPNIAEFAKTSYWFRYTTTVSSETTSAIPAILTGISPNRKLLPNITDHPNNLFTMLSKDYKFNVHELATYLCPEELSSRYKGAQPFESRIHALLSDLSIVFLHVILPNTFTHNLPLITNQWGNFGKIVLEPEKGAAKVPTGEDLVKRIHSHLGEDRAAYYHKFVSSIDGRRDTLNFIHLMLPHNPMEYLPSGKKHSLFTEIEGVSRVDDRFIGPQGLVDQFHYRHLLQLAYVDHLLGELIKQLKDKNLFEESLIIFLADHGASFTSNEYNRRLSDTNIGDLIFVPLLIKTPGQKEGIIRDEPATTVDILPTIATVLGTKIPWPTSGTSLLEPQPTPVATRSFLNQEGKVYHFPYTKLLHLRETAHLRNIKLFGLNDDTSNLFWFGKYRSLLGKPSAEIKTEAGDFTVETDQRKLFDYVDLKSNFVPAKINGKLFLKNSGSAAPSIAISVNGIIQGVTDTYLTNKGLVFSTVIPDTSFRQGKNDVAFYLIRTGSNGQHSLISTESSSQSYILKSDEIVVSGARHIPIAINALQGMVDDITLNQTNRNNLNISGWAVNAEKSKPADVILLFVNGIFFNSYKTDAFRPDIAKVFKTKKLDHCGFSDIIPAKLIPNFQNIRVFAISDNIASELEYNKALGIKPDHIKKMVPGGPRYTVSDNGITSSTGSRSDFEPDKISASVDTIKKRGSYVTISGWAANVEKSKMVDSILVFEGKKFLASGKTSVLRPDLNKSLKPEKTQFFGFDYQLPISAVKSLDDIRVFAVSEGMATEVFIPKKTSLDGPRYSMGDETLVSANGETINIYPQSLQGSLDAEVIRAKRVSISGWATNATRGLPVDTLVVFHGKEFIGSGKPTTPRPDVGKAFNNRKLDLCGFDLMLPKNIRDAKEIRIFAVSGNIAMEISNRFKKVNSDESNRSKSSHFILTTDRILTDKADTIVVKPATLDGSTDLVTLKGDTITVEGWAANTKQPKPAELVVAFYENEAIASAKPRVARPDVGKAFSSDKLDYCGYALSFPASRAKNLGKVRVFAVLDGTATELNNAVLAAEEAKTKATSAPAAFPNTTSSTKPGM